MDLLPESPVHWAVKAYYSSHSDMAAVALNKATIHFVKGGKLRFESIRTCPGTRYILALVHVRTYSCSGHMRKAPAVDLEKSRLAVGSQCLAHGPKP
jgi:hypothetical protein